MKKLLLLSFVFLLGNQVINAQITETEPNNSVLQLAVLTVSSATTITGDVCLAGSCPTADPTDHWIIADGSSGTFIATWSDNVVVTLFTYATSARNTVPSSVTLSSGVSQTLSASSFYSISIQFQSIGVLTSYSVALSGNSLTTPPSVPSVNHGPPIICSGNSALLTWTGNLNDATEWHIYTGSCGGTEIDTTTGNSVIVTPPTSGSITYFVRGEGGGVTPGACGSHTITITAREDANFSYSAASYLTTDVDPTPTITGVGGGDFSRSPAGLIINTSTGTIDVSASTPGMYTVTYETSGLCSGTEDRNITIIAPNTPPTASSFTASNGPFEDLTYTFSTADFGYSDTDSDPLDNVLIEIVPPVGTLYIDADNGDDFDAGEQLTNGSIVSKANLDAGNLQYIQNGSVNTSFQFEVNDGTVNSSGNYIATLNVSAIPSVTLSIDDASDLESTTSNNIVTATLLNTYGANTTVNLAFSGTAINTTDYTRSANSITINAGSMTGTINLNNVSDALDENDETVIVDITGVTNGIENGIQQVTYTILDDDSTPTLSISDPTISEGNSGSTNATFTISLSAASGKTVTVNYATADNTATIADGDYNQVTTTGVIFLPGETSKMITVGVNGDAKVESNESFFVNLSTPFNATISNGQGTGIITNDDQAAVTIADVAVNENSGTATITLIVDNAVDGGFDVDVSTADGTATTADSDYTAVTAQTLTFAGTAGESETFNITLGGDTKVEADETASISMSALNPVTVASGDIDITDGATLTINNDDQATVTIANVSGNEDDGAITVTVIVDNAVDGGFDVDVSTADGTATTANSDYTAVTAQTLTFAGTAGETETFTITPTADATSESDETVIIGMSGLSPSTVASGDINITDGATLTILNDDNISISVNDPSIAEGDAGTNTLQFTVSLNAPAPAGGATVDYATSNGSATAGSDYTAISTTTLSFLAGESSKTVDITITSDQIVEIDETLTLTLSNPTGTNVIIGDSTGTGTITNDDQATVTIADVTVNENSGTATITVIADNAVDGGFDVDVSTADGTATTADSDYTTVTAQTLTFAGTAGESETFNITLGGDTKVEADETASISMSALNPVTVASGDIDITDGATLTINNDDQATVTIANVSGNEDDGAITVTVIVDNAIDGGFDVDVSTADGTATTADSDYSAVTAQTLTFAGTAGETETFTITPTADATSEPDETVIIEMSGLSPSTVASGDINITDGATLTILNDDAAVLSIVATTQAAENITNGLFTISTTNQFSTPVTVNLSVTGTATSGTDFTALGTTFTFPANTNSATITVPVIADNLVESNETVIVTLTGTNNSAVAIGSTDNATVTITDDDIALLSITATTQAEEGTTNGVYTVNTTNEFSIPVMVTISATGTAISGTDYDDLGSSFMFPANTSSITIPLSVIDDNIVELDETVILTMTNTNNTSVTIGTTDEATITITDPDIATITIEDVNANEDDGAITVIATLDNEAPGGFTVDINTTDGTATLDDNDYTAIINQTLSFTGNAGETQTFTILPTEDATPESDETVTVTLSNVANTSLEINSTDSALITILNDDDLDIRIYPNPTAGEVNIDIPLNLVLVYNVTGKKILETKNNSFSITDLPSGIYFIRIETINGSIERKLVKI